MSQGLLNLLMMNAPSTFWSPLMPCCNRENYPTTPHLLLCVSRPSLPPRPPPCISGTGAWESALTAIDCNYTQATALVVTYPVVNAVSEDGNAAAVAWEQEFIRLVKEELVRMAAAGNLTLSYSSESSIEAELQRESTADVLTIAISYLVMFVYIAITLGDYTPSVAPFYVTSKVIYF